MAELFWFVVIWAVICGYIGRFVAMNKGVDTKTGFLLGALLGPFGCIIVGLLNPTESYHDFHQVRPSKDAVAHKTQSTIGLEDCLMNRDLDNAKYRLWLVKNYAIERDYVLGELIVGERCFKNVDDALRFAHEKENERDRL